MYKKIAAILLTSFLIVSTTLTTFALEQDAPSTTSEATEKQKNPEEDTTEKPVEEALPSAKEETIETHDTFMATTNVNSMVHVTYAFADVEQLPQEVKDKLPLEETILKDTLTEPKVDAVVVKEEDKNYRWFIESWSLQEVDPQHYTYTAKWNKELNYHGNVTFVADGVETIVHFEHADEPLYKTDQFSKRLDDSNKGGGSSKKYFIGYSLIPNYVGKQKGDKAFYTHEPISKVFPNGLQGDERLYAFYLSASNVLTLAESMKGDFEINKQSTPEEIMHHKFEVKEDFTYYVPNDIQDENIVQINASYTLNPFTTAVIRRSNQFEPGSVEYYGDEVGASTSADVKEAGYTFVDIHVKLDHRIKLKDEITLSFKAYAFKPHMVLKANHEKFNQYHFDIQPNNPVSIIKFHPEGENEFILRTRIRHKSEIPNATFEDITQDIELASVDVENFKISKESILEIAEETHAPISLNGDVSGGAKLYEINFLFFKLGGPTPIAKREAKPKYLNYVFDKVQFIKNSQAFDTQTQDLGSIQVVHNQSIAGDILPHYSMPTLPDNVVKDGYRYQFLGWSLDSNATTPDFDANHIVNQNLTVYGVWKKVEKTVLKLQDLTIYEDQSYDEIRRMVLSVEDELDHLSIDDVVIDYHTVVNANKVAGVYIITFTVTNSDGVVETKTATLTVLKRPIIIHPNISHEVEETIAVSSHFNIPKTQDTSNSMGYLVSLFLACVALIYLKHISYTK